MFYTIEHFFQFMFSNWQWLAFVSIIAWIVFAPSLNRFINRTGNPDKKDRFYID